MYRNIQPIDNSHYLSNDTNIGICTTNNIILRYDVILRKGFNFNSQKLKYTTKTIYYKQRNGNWNLINQYSNRFCKNGSLI
jgi:hypothetical protein